MAEGRVASAVLALSGAALMVVSLFLDWYRIDPGSDSGDIDISGWDAFETVDLLLLGAAVATFFVVVRGSREVSAAADRRLLLLGMIMAVIIVTQLIDKPPLIGFPGGFDVSLRIGAWMAVAGALLVLAGGVLTSRAPR